MYNCLFDLKVSRKYLYHDVFSRYIVWLSVQIHGSIPKDVWFLEHNLFSSKTNNYTHGNDHIKSSERWQVLTLSYVRSVVDQRHVAGSNCRSQIHFAVLAVLPIPMLCQFNRSFVLVGSQMDHKTTIIAYTNAIWPLRTGSDYVIEGHAVHFAHPNMVIVIT